MALKFKKNTVRANIFDYNLAIFGVQGVGKTTLAYEVCNKLVPDQYVIFNCGREDGIKALNNAIYYDAPTWDELEEAIDEIEENRSTEFKDLKVVVLDTIDEIFNMAENEIIKRSNREGKPCTTINAAYSGFGAGIQKTVDLVLDTLWRLKSVGINVFYIGHIKSKTMVDPVSDMEYQVLTSNLSNRYFSSIATKMDVIGICYIDRDIITEKTKRKDMKGKIIEKNVVANEARKICFRSDNYVVECKSRFPAIASEVDLNADSFIKAIEDAIKAQIESSGRSEEEIRAEQKAAEEKRMAEIAAAEEKNKAAKEVKAVINDIVAFIQENKSNMAKIKPILAKCKEIGVSNPTEITNLEDALKVAELIK